MLDDPSLPTFMTAIFLGLAIAFAVPALKLRASRRRRDRIVCDLARSLVLMMAERPEKPSVIVIPGQFIDDYGDDGLSLLALTLAVLHDGWDGTVGDVLEAGAGPGVVELAYSLTADGGDWARGGDWIAVWNRLDQDARERAVCVFAYRAAMALRSRHTAV